jgi:hypothetical protein
MYAWIKLENPKPDWHDVEHVVLGGRDLLYIYEEGGKYGYGIRIKGIGLTHLSKPEYDRDEAKREATLVYNTTSVEGFFKAADELPSSLTARDGTPKHP